jgi:4,5-dihydroxyphthalate decarboxylase
MTALKLKTVTRTQGSNRALKDRSVTPATCELDFNEVPVLTDAFRRMVRGLEFDVCEMALSTYVCARAHGKPFTALPIFLVRAFHHGAIHCGRDAGIDVPADLHHRKVGVYRGYTGTTAVWARSILQHQYGVDLDSITWMLSGDEHVAEYKPPPNVLRIERGAEMAALVASGELAAGIGLDPEAPGLRTLIPDAAEAGLRALRDRGFYPINHLVVVKDEILDAHPGLAADLFDAFARAKREYVDALTHDRIETATATDKVYLRVAEITGKDPLPYGIEPNLDVLEGFMRDVVRQGIIDRPIRVDALFHPETRELVG